MTPAVHLVNTPQEWQRVQWMLRAADWVSFDVETTGIEDWREDSRIVTVAFATTPDEAWVLPLAHPEAAHGASPTEVFETLAGCKLVGHNVKFDARWVNSYAGLDVSNWLAWDTMAGAFLLDENRPLSLKSLAVADLGVDQWDDLAAKTDPLSVPLDQLATYNGLDATHTHGLHLFQRDKLRNDPLGKVLWFVLMPAIRALTSIEQEGMRLDIDRVREMLGFNEREIARLEQELLDGTPQDLLAKYAKNIGQQDLFGGEVKPDVSWAPTSKFFLEYAERAGWPVLRRSEKTDKPAWPAAVLRQVALQGFPDAGRLVDQRKLTKQTTAFLAPWSADLPPDGRVHPTYWPTRYEDDNRSGGTVTGRLACSGPNMQQVPKALKQCFDAPDGWVFVQADMSQVEVRIVAHVSGDPALQRVYREGRDVYRETAAGILGKSSDEVTPEERQRTKPVVLGFLYGMGAPSFVDYARDTYGITYELDESESVRRSFFDLFPGLTDWHERTRRLVRRQGFITSPIGRVRRVPAAMDGDRTERGRAERQAINAQIQSFASDLMLMALARVRDELPRPAFRSVGTVHDSLLGYASLDYARANGIDVSEVARRVGRIMVTPNLAPFGVELSVPLAADVEYGPRWGEAEHELSVSSLDLREAQAA